MEFPSVFLVHGVHLHASGTVHLVHDANLNPRPQMDCWLDSRAEILKTVMREIDFESPESSSPHFRSRLTLPCWRCHSPITIILRRGVAGICGTPSQRNPASSPALQPSKTPKGEREKSLGRAMNSPGEHDQHASTRLWRTSSRMRTTMVDSNKGTASLVRFRFPQGAASDRVTALSAPCVPPPASLVG